MIITDLFPSGSPGKTIFFFKNKMEEQYSKFYFIHVLVHAFHIFQVNTPFTCLLLLRRKVITKEDTIGHGH